MPKIYSASVFTNQGEHWKYDLMSEVYPDGTFELLPILLNKEPVEIGDCKKDFRKYLRTYGDVPSWHQPKKSVADHLKFEPHVASWLVHDDPNLHTLMAYGDVKSSRGSGLFKMIKGDWIIFIAHLVYASKPGKPEPKHAKTGWYLVGCLKATHIEFAGAGRKFSDRVEGHAHWLWGQYVDFTLGDKLHNIIIAGDRKRSDQRFEMAVPILTREHAMRLIRDKNGKPLDPSEGKQTVKSSIGSHTRTGRCIADTSASSDMAYVQELRSAILERNPALADLLW